MSENLGNKRLTIIIISVTHYVFQSMCMHSSVNIIPLESLGSGDKTQTRRKVLQPLNHLLSLHNTFKGLKKKKLLYFAASELFFFSDD